MNLFQMVEGLAPIADLHVFAASTGFTTTAQAVPHSLIARAASRVPLLRRGRDWVAMIEDTHFDRWVAPRLPAAQWFHGVTGQCTHSLRVARSMGMATVLDVITPHIDEFLERCQPEYDRFGVRFPIHAMARARIREEYANADRIRVMSTPALRTFLDRGFRPDRVVVVRPLLTLEATPLTRRPEQFTVGFIGALEPWKGVHYLVDAFRRVAGKDWQLRIIGGTVARGTTNYFRETVRQDSRITIAPADVRRAGFEQVYGRLSVLVYPSVCDGFAFAAAEAMACGIPVVVTATTGAADLVEEGRNGFVVPPQNSDAIAQRLQELHADIDGRAEMGLRARAAALNCTPERFRQEYTSLLKGKVPL